jgi:hypothetical protein
MSSPYWEFTAMKYLVLVVWLIAAVPFQVQTAAADRTFTVEASQVDADNLPELRIVLSDSGIGVPSKMLIGEADLVLSDNGERDRRHVTLQLQRLPDAGAPAATSVDPASGGSVVVTDESRLSDDEFLVPIVLISLINEGRRDVALQLVQVPASISIDDAVTTLTSHGNAVAWLDDAFYPGLPIMPQDGAAARAVVQVPFTFPMFANYLLYDRDRPNRFVGFQAIVNLSDPVPSPSDDADADETEGDDADEADDEEAPIPDDPGPMIYWDVDARITADSLEVSQPIELGRQIWAVSNRTAEPRSFLVYRVPEDTTPGQILAYFIADLRTAHMLDEPSFERMGGISQFTGENDRLVEFTLGPGVYVVVALSSSAAWVVHPPVYVTFALSP